MKKRTSKRLVLLFMVAAWVLIPLTTASADVCEFIDQECDEPINPALWGFYLSSAPIGQTFTPTQPYVNCVEALLQNFSRFDTRVYLFIREGGITGRIINTGQVKSVAIPGAMPPTWVNFKLCYPVKVTPGRLYTIQLVAENEAETEVGWLTPDPDKFPNPYTRGELIVSGASPGRWDFNFRTNYKPQAQLALVNIYDFWLSSDQAGANRITSIPQGKRFYAQFEYRVDYADPARSVYWVRTLASIATFITDHRHLCATDIIGEPMRDTITFTDGWPYGPLKTVVIGEVWLENHEGQHNMKITTTPITITAP